MPVEIIEKTLLMLEKAGYMPVFRANREF